MDEQDNQASSWLPESAESTRALEELTAFQDPDAIPTVLVYERAEGLTGADVAAATAQVEEIARLAAVEGEVVGPIPSEDGAAMQTVLTVNVGPEGWNLMPDVANDLREIAAIDGVDVHVAGPGGQAADSAEAFGGIDTTLLLATLSVVVVILLLTYRSPVLWVLPIVCAGVALFGAQALIYFLARYADLTVNGQSYAILTILVIGAGTDYALLLVARYREELRRHADRHEAMAFALHRAAPAILASAGTVTLEICLVVAEMNSTAGLGPVAAIGIAVTFLVQVTLLPALLVVCGRWVFWPKVPTFGSPEPTRTGIWARVGRAIQPRPRRVWAVTTLLLGVACLGLFRLDTSGLSTEDSYTEEFSSITGQRARGARGARGARRRRVRRGGRHPRRLLPRGVRRRGGRAGGDARRAGGRRPGRRGLGVLPRHQGGVGPGQPRDHPDHPGGGLRDPRLLLRALLSPLVLVATVVLSFGAAMGISAVVFEQVFGFAGSDPSFPLFAFVFLVALGIDYNIFLMTRVREETLASDTRTGSLVALTSTGGVITSAGLVLAATFLVLGTIPVVFLAELGFAVALGVVLDTMVVRSVLVTAINLDLGARIWWPSRLDRSREPQDPADGRRTPPAQRSASASQGAVSSAGQTSSSP